MLPASGRHGTITIWGCVALALLATQTRAAGVQSREELQRAEGQADYFEQGIQRIEYYGAQLAILRYRDGSSLRLGLVVPYTEAPIQSVDCDAQPSDLVAIEDREMGLGFMTYAELAAQGEQHRGSPFPEHARRVLKELEAEFVRRCDSMARASVDALESTLLVLDLALIEQGIRAPTSAAGGVAARAVGRVVAKGLSQEAAEAAVAGMRSGGGHAIRHLLGEGLISDVGPLTTKVEAFRRLALPILTRPLGRPFAWRIGETQAMAFLGRVMGRWIAVVVAEDGPWAGNVIAGLVPDSNQLALMLGRAGLGGL